MKSDSPNASTAAPENHCMRTQLQGKAISAEQHLPHKDLRLTALNAKKEKDTEKKNHKIAVWLKVRAVISDSSSSRTISNRILIVQQAEAAG